jgi:hypothetical protein
VSQFLYRGVSDQQLADGKALTPKGAGPFIYTFRHDGTLRYDGSATFGPSETNAVLRHELRQEGFPSSGISTTPFFERAEYYATSGGKRSIGHVLKFDRAVVLKHAIREYVVADWIPSPSAPEDNEVILVAQDCGPLPDFIVLEVINVVAKN